MTLGITYAGEVGRVGADTSPEEVVEMVCTDPRFLEAASAKKPNFLVRLFNGAASFPLDWWYGATFLATRAYVFATDGKSATDATANTIEQQLSYGFANLGYMRRVIFAVLGHLRHYPEFWARSGTQLAVGAAVSSTIGFAGGLAVSTANFFIATTGAIARAVDNGASTLAEMIVAAGLGQSDPALAAIVAQEISAPPPVDGDYDLDQEEEDFIVQTLRGVLHCVRNPEEYMNSEERRRTTHVPVGRVSSARPRGVMGNIPIGYETNALDVLADDAAMLRRSGSGGSW